MPRVRPTAVIPHLVRAQANSVELYFQYKGYHWNVAGPFFRDLHLLFDEHAAKVFEMIDAFAERQRMLGGAAVYTLDALHRAGTLPHEGGLPQTTREMLERLLASHRVIIEEMHEGFKVAEQEADPGTADMFARYVQDHEKMEWFLRELVSEPLPVSLESGSAGVVGEKGGFASPLPGGHAPAPFPGHPLTS
jgi:starvation-inducible DNA-binding protein